VATYLLGRGVVVVVVVVANCRLNSLMRVTINNVPVASDPAANAILCPDCDRQVPVVG
jgi:hypothetical protein